MFALADLRGGGVAIQLRHLAIHEHEIVGFARQRGERLAAVGDDVGGETELFEQAERDLLVDDVVLGEEDADAGFFRGSLGCSRVWQLRRGGGGGPFPRAGEAGVELGLPDRFVEAGAEPGEALRFLVGMLGHGGEHDEPRGGERGLGGDGAGELEAVEKRHLHIEDREIERRALGGGLVELEQRLETVGGAGVADLPGGELVFEDAAVGDVVVHHQHAQAGEPGGRRTRGGRTGRGLGQPHGEPERRTFSHLALHADLAAHAGGELARNGEAEPGAAVFPRDGRIALRKGMEKRVPDFRRDADAGVGDGETQRGVALGLALARDADHDFAACGELDGVADEIGQHLAEAVRIAAQLGGHLVVNEAGEFELFSVRALGEQPDGLLHALPQIEVRAFEMQLPGLHFREVEDVADHAEQALRASANGGAVVALTLVQVGGQKEIRHTDDTIHRGANLVAHVREEGALRAVRVLGALLGGE